MRVLKQIHLRSFSVHVNKMDVMKIKEVAERAKEMALLSGLQMRPAESPSSSDLIHHGPFTLFPSKIPSKLLSQAKEAQKDFNLMMHRVAHDHDFLYQSLKNVIKVDEFTKHLWDIYEAVKKEGPVQTKCLGLFRNDYMMDTGGTTNTNMDNLKLKQIEFNTIASSFGGLVSQLRDVHRYSLSEADIEFKEDNMPDNNPANGLAGGLVIGWESYGKQSAYVLFIVDKVERNRMDQLWLEKEAFNINRHCKVIYSTFQDIGTNSVLNDSKELFIDGKEIAVVYFRSGYSPDQYKSQQDWDTRLKIERSKAIKCPTVHYQLAGTKKIQQELARPGAVERFLSDPVAVGRVRQTFIGQYSLDKGSEGDEVIERAIKEPRKFVVKPQREGGGNNLYDEQIPDFLKENRDSDERSAYIIMERIFPFVQKNYLIKKGEELLLRNVVNEIGIYGVLLGSETDILENKEIGHLVRTKSEDSNEGGVVVGFSVIDTPYLIFDINEGWTL
ncbi:glutathione synthetase-like isoform X1 [Mytilus edulis]|uniref:glutathione synthetase-like isoform X1 n=2 Tax=Mytilus edulis TaxID=6550 RepID=UPI0039F0023D